MYRKLYELWLKERSTRDLQEVPPSLYELVSGYIATIGRKRRMLDKNTIEAVLLKHESEEAEELAERLLELRLKKILEKMSSDDVIPINLLTNEEREFYGKLKDAFARQKVIRGVLKGTAGRPRTGRNKLIRFARKIPVIIGTDLRKYGPFDVEDIAYIPADSAEMLVKRGVAVEVNVRA